MDTNLRLTGSARAWWGSWRLDIVLMLVLSSIAIAWTLPLGNYLYSQDGLSFLFPLNPNHNPLFAYSLTASRSATSLSFSGLYVSLSENALGSVLPGAIAERAAIFLGTLLALVGLFELFRTLNLANGVDERLHPVSKAVSAFAYLTCPLALSVLWPSIQYWSVFACFAPWVVAFTVRTLYTRRVDWVRACVYSAIGIVLAPGITGAFAVAFLIPVSLGILGVLLLLVFRRITVREGGRVTLGLVAFSVLTLAWTLIPSVLSFNSSIPASISQHQVTYLQVAHSEAVTTSLWNVIGEVGYSWIYSSPGSYPWITLLEPIRLAMVLMFSLVVLLVVFPPSTTRLRGGLPLLALALVTVLLCAGLNSPADSLFTALIQIGGPFLILVNPYYFLGPLYAVAVSGLLYLALLGFRWVEFRRTPSAPIVRRWSHSTSARLLGRRVQRRWKINVSSWGRSPLLAVACAVGLAALLIVMATPFLSGQVYTTAGSSATSIHIPNSYYELRSALMSNFTSPTYYALVLPLSSATATYFYYGSASFADSTGLLADFIPYPTFWSNTTPYAAALDDILAGSNVVSLTAVFQALHIRYVVFNQDYVSNFPMTHAPNGLSVGLGHVLSLLNSSAIERAQFGALLLYTIPNVSTFVQAQSDPSLVRAASFEQYLEALSRINDTGTLTDGIDDSLWMPLNSSVTDGNIVTPIGVDGFPGQVSIPGVQRLLVVDSNGTVVSNHSGVMLEPNGIALVKPPVLASLSNSSTFTTNFQINGTALSDPTGNGVIELLPSGNGSTALDLQFSSENIVSGESIGVEFLGPNLELGAFVAESVNPPGLYGLELWASPKNGSSVGANYAWSNYFISMPNQLRGESQDLKVWLNATTLDAALQNASAGWVVRGNLYFDASDISRNQGYNRTQLPSSPIALANYSAEIQAYEAISVTNFTWIKSLEISYLLGFSSSESSSQVLSTEVSTDATGDFTLHLISGDTSPIYVILMSTEQSEWEVTSDGGLWTRVNLNGLTNVFELQENTVSEGGNLATVGFVSVQPYFVAGSVVELSGLAIAVVSALVIGTIRRPEVHGPTG
jgi:hypothetical protein